MATASETALAALKTALDGGKLYWFAGPVPATAEEALDMATAHTQLVVMTKSGDGTTGLTFDAPSGNAMVKAAAETWSGLVSFDGANAASSSLDATFYRFCPVGDDGRSLTTGVRLQGRIGPADSDFPMASPTLTANGTNTQGASYFAIVEEAG